MLKDLIKSDLKTLFNNDEFAETHNINGKDIDIVIDNELLKERQVKYAEGTYLGDVLFYVKKDDFGIEPAIYQHIKFDGETKFINDFQEEAGTYIITLGERKS